MTDKQRKFADEYLADCNATRAYKAAYPNIKNQRTAESAGNRLLSNVEVKEYIDQKLEEISSAKIADVKEVMEYLTSVMRRDHSENVVVTLQQETSRYVPDDEGKMRKETIKGEAVEIVEIPAKLSDANKAAELLGKRYNLFTDKIQVEGAVPIVISGEDELEE